MFILKLKSFKKNYFSFSSNQASADRKDDIDLIEIAEIKTEKKFKKNLTNKIFKQFEKQTKKIQIQLILTKTIKYSKAK